jgi:hypothetical protein
MNSSGLPAAEAAEFPRASQGSLRAPRRRNPAVEAEAATATRSRRRSRVLWWAEPRPPAAAAAADDGGFAMAGRRGCRIRSNGLDLTNSVVYCILGDISVLPLISKPFGFANFHLENTERLFGFTTKTSNKITKSD